jgi:hypothetical protein
MYLLFVKRVDKLRKVDINSFYKFFLMKFFILYHKKYISFMYVYRIFIGYLICINKLCLVFSISHKKKYFVLIRENKRNMENYYADMQKIDIGYYMCLYFEYRL